MATAGDALRKPSGRPSSDRLSSARRAETAADTVTELINRLPPGARLGTKEELRTMCAVSVGTFNETLRLLHSRGLVTVRPGPGGGLFAAEQSPTVRLGNSVLALDAEQTGVAEAMRIRDALEPLLIEDALWHGSPADIADLREELARMAQAVAEEDWHGFVLANWHLHARIAAISPDQLLRSLYTSLLETIESHTLSVLPGTEQPLREYVQERHALHVAIVDALQEHDRERTLELIAIHNTTPAAGAGHAGPDA